MLSTRDNLDIYMYIIYLCHIHIQSRMFNYYTKNLILFPEMIPILNTDRRPACLARISLGSKWTVNIPYICPCRQRPFQVEGLHYIYFVLLSINFIIDIFLQVFPGLFCCACSPSPLGILPGYAFSQPSCSFYVTF